MRRWIPIVLLGPWSAAQSSGQPETDVALLRLENGVEIRLERVPGATAMGLFLFMRSGYVDDPAGRTGLAHLTEHMVMTAPTPTRGQRWSYARWNRERLGANAMTRPDWTLFWSLGDRDQLSEDARHWADVLAGRSRFSETGLLAARRAMLRETINMTEGVPGGILQWRARARAFASQPFGRQGIGIRTEVEQITLAEVQRHYERYYRPGAALLVAVGKVHPVKDAPFYREVFGGIEPRPAPRRAEAGGASDVPPAVGPHARIGGAFCTYAFKAPPPPSEDFPVFLLASMWLSHRAQRDFAFRGLEGVGLFMPAVYPVLEDPRLMFLNRRGVSGQTVDAVRAEMTEWLDKTVAGEIGSSDLELPLLQLENLLDPLPRGKRRQRLIARQPRMLYGVGLARGAVRLDGLPPDLWQKLQRVGPDRVRGLIQDRFRPKEAVFVALEPAAKK